VYTTPTCRVIFINRKRSISQLESWFKGGGARKAPGSRPASQSSMLRPSSESDFTEAEDKAIKIFAEQVEKMSEKEVNVKFDELLVRPSTLLRSLSG
jgi:hypothetical protein